MLRISGTGRTKKPPPLRGLIFLSLTLVFAAGVWLSPLAQAFYGTDDRKELFELSGRDLEDADSVAALFPAAQVLDWGDGRSALLTVQYGEYYNLCPSERFREQPSGSFCSGVLVAPDIIATAAHCIEGKNVSDIRIVFGYRMRDETTPELVIPNSEIYHGVEVIGWQHNDSGSDWALIRLDRSVPNHRIAPIRKDGAISDSQPVQVIGHPKGLPVKFAGGAKVRDNRYRAFFTANLDSYAGNSGSPVFNSMTHEVEGILVRGKKRPFVKQGDCWISRVCPDSGCGGEDSTRTTEFAYLID
jgi:V8-like Glu-specific endopeptidase